jgi:hypothetical protein
MSPVGTIAALAAALIGQVNLLTNPGFELRSGESPVGWDRFVLPQPGAVGRLDAEAHTGEASALLHTPLPYRTDPVNNWSQNVYREFSRKEYVARAHIRTVDVGQAALWVQCWQRGQRFPHAFYTTADASPMRGTRPWELVEVRFKVPVGTDFVTLRCVLLGTGSAWFDEVYLGEVVEEAVPEDEDAKASPMPTATPTPAVKAPEGAEEQIAVLRAEIEKLKQSHYLLAGAVDELRRQLRDLQAAARKPEPPKPPARPSVPLVDGNK